MRKDADRAEEYYRRALEVNPADAGNLGNYAVFLEDVRKDADRAEEYYRRALEVNPAHAGNMGNYAVFLKNVRKDADRAEEYYRRALEVNPTHAGNLGNYALFLKEVRKDADRAEEYYRRALEVNPTHAGNMGNYAGFLFALMDDRVGAQQVLARARSLELPDALKLEVAFYRYAHVAEERDAGLVDLHRLVVQGVRSPGFDLTANVARASHAGHPNPELLAAIARVIADQVPADVLDRHPDWISAGS